MDEMDRDSGNKTQSIDDVSITLCQNSSWTMDSKIYGEVLKKMLELFLKIQENIRIPILKGRLRMLYKKENFKSEVKCSNTFFKVLARQNMQNQTTFELHTLMI